MAFQSAKQIILAILIFLFSFGNAPAFDISRMPEYNIEEAAKRYQAIGELNMEYYRLNAAFNQIIASKFKITKEDHIKILTGIDKYLYWISVANIHIFYKEYDQMYSAVAKAKAGLEEFKEVLVNIVQKQTF